MEPIRPIVLAILIASPACALACANSPEEPSAYNNHAVVGGIPASPSDYPSTVALTDPSGDPFCSGTLVAPTVVVTAAHCIKSGSPSNVRVVHGYAVPSLAPASERRVVASAIPHPNYSPLAPTDAYGLGPLHDIGVLLLEEAIPNAVVAPILPTDFVDAILTPNRPMHIVGFGINDTQTQASGELYKALTPHVRHVPTELLGGRPGEPDACFGDSGGPAYVVNNNTLWLVGATSRAWEHASQPCGHATVYTLVSHYAKWISSVGGELDGGITDGGFAGGGWEAGEISDATVLDGNPSCVPLNSACHPMTNEGCNTSAGEACRLDPLAGSVACSPGPNEAEPGKLCDQSTRFCRPGYFCGASIRCEKLCCSDSDCPVGIPCAPLISLLGDIGTCGPVSMDIDAAALDSSLDVAEEDALAEEDAQAEAGLDAGQDADSDAVPSDADADGPWGPPDAVVPSGCSCSTRRPAHATSAVGLVFGLIGTLAWRRRRRLSDSPA
jgi:MYXO-CTERM domain-containing protein